MKPIRTALAAVFAVIFTVMGASAEPVYTKGVVKNVKPEDGKVTIIHEELVELEMPAMTMVSRGRRRHVRQARTRQGDRVHSRTPEWQADRHGSEMTRVKGGGS